MKMYDIHANGIFIIRVSDRAEAEKIHDRLRKAGCGSASITRVDVETEKVDLPNKSAWEYPSSTSSNNG